MARSDRATRLLKVIGILDQIRREEFYDHDKEIIDYLRGQLTDATMQLTNNDKARIRDYAFEAIQEAHRQQELWDSIEAELEATK